MSLHDERTAQHAVNVGLRWDATQVERALGGLERRVRRRRAGRIAVAAAALLVLGLGLGSAGLLQEPQDVARPSVATALRMEDGSTVTPIGEAKLVVNEVSPALVRVRLDEGRVDVDVTPRPERRFIIEMAAVRVMVLGTRFQVDTLESAKARVRVERGRVRVEWAGGEHTLLAGEEGVFPEAPSAMVVAPPAPVEVAPVAPVGATATSDWRPLAERGVYGRAYDLIQRGGERVVRDEVDDLLLAADAARLSGHAPEALPYLERVIAGHHNDERAAMAAFTKGLVLLGLERPLQAAQAYEQAVSLGARGSLRENAFARAAEAYHRGGDAENAARCARTYLEAYPQGQWAPTIRAYGAPPP